MDIKAIQQKNIYNNKFNKRQLKEAQLILRSINAKKMVQYNSDFIIYFYFTYKFLNDQFNFISRYPEDESANTQIKISKQLNQSLLQGKVRVYDKYKEHNTEPFKYTSKIKQLSIALISSLIRYQLTQNQSSTQMQNIYFQNQFELKKENQLITIPKVESIV
ncbi:hypothetical protein TTHERM_01011050 (macronuclear) [Tetrahymena thermophila SB210]|uniref:Uncharacterized protein n=1 Tax=Tetrahymena thermophila (strain SB210) TaxID=312017 RepID=Q23LP0_TETTS|nr:hypothetical protein TTHERM_01011050 [Tetrahymena thermophila SB210]EAR97470.1 hypothetical protein TTHERM_01011050 [Tetrahymena thermophila SB210]|eukprot:XP_001017715.1 hypothetical protein TTHERM_01011050 [Tetrahymena thermophila SB210]